MELLSDSITFQQDGRFDNSMCRLYIYFDILDSLFYYLTYAAYAVDWHLYKRNKRECHHVCNANTCINNNHNLALLTTYFHAISLCY